MQAGLICGGWDPYEGGQVYEIPLGTTIHYFNGETLWSKNRYFLLSFLSNSVILSLVTSTTSHDAGFLSSNLYFVVQFIV